MLSPDLCCHFEFVQVGEREVQGREGRNALGKMAVTFGLLGTRPCYSSINVRVAVDH